MKDKLLGVAVLLLTVLVTMHTYGILELKEQIVENEVTTIELQEDIERLTDIVTELNIKVK